MMYLIILPQALKLVIPGIVNTFIGLFKDTTLVLIVGMFDLLGQIQSSFTDPNVVDTQPGPYGLPFSRRSCSSSSASACRATPSYMEKALHTGHKR
jgi:general L-amino acid transport system permease protein